MWETRLSTADQKVPFVVRLHRFSLIWLITSTKKTWLIRDLIKIWSNNLPTHLVQNPFFFFFFYFPLFSFRVKDMLHEDNETSKHLTMHGQLRSRACVEILAQTYVSRISLQVQDHTEYLKRKIGELGALCNDATCTSLGQALLDNTN